MDGHVILSVAEIALAFYLANVPERSVFSFLVRDKKVFSKVKAIF